MQAGYAVTALGWDRSAGLPCSEERDGFTILRRPIQAGYARGLMNFIPLLRWEVDLLVWLVRHRKEYDLIHACDFDTILPALAAKVLFGKKVIYDIFDFYADHLRATPEWVKRLIRVVDLWAIGRADALILVDDARREQIAGSRPKRLEVIYNSPEDVLPLVPFSWEESGDEPSLGHFSVQEIGDDRELRLAYVGLLQVERGLLDVLQALRRHPQWKLDLAGFGGDEVQILQAAADLPNVTFYGRVSYEKAIELSAAADVLFALYDPTIPNHRYSSPNKVFEALMLGKPILVARHTNMDRIVDAAGAGLVVDYGDVEAIEAALLRLAEQPELRRALGYSARQSYESEYDWKIMQRRLLQVYQDTMDIRELSIQQAPSQSSSPSYRPWDETYLHRREKLVQGILSNQDLLAIFNEGKRLPDHYGIGFDERCIEYPWVFAHLPPGAFSILDAGSALNFEYLVDAPLLSDKKLHIVTLSPERECYYSKGISYIFDDIRDLPIRNDYYDAIVCISTLEHIGFDNSVYTKDQRYKENHPDDFLKALVELRRILKPGGELLVTIPYGADGKFRSFQQFNPDLVKKVIAAFGATDDFLLSYYLYTKDGWQIVDEAQCREAQYVHWVADAWENNRRLDPIPVEPDLAAAARAVACLKFVKSGG